jgi:hypothetical protein
VNAADLFNDPKYRKPLAIGGVAAVAGLALVMKKRAAAGAKSSAPSGSWISAAPPPDAPVDTNAAALGSALAGLAQASANLQDVANGLKEPPAPVPGAGAAPAAAAAPGQGEMWNPQGLRVPTPVGGAQQYTYWNPDGSPVTVPITTPIPIGAYDAPPSTWGRR